MNFEALRLFFCLKPKKYVLSRVKRGAERVGKEIPNEGKDHQGLPVQIENASQKCSVAELGTQNKIPTLHVHILPLFALPKGLGMENKLKHWIGSVYFYLKCCIKG